MINPEMNHMDLPPGPPRGALPSMSGPPPPNGPNFMSPPGQHNNIIPMSEDHIRHSPTRTGPDEGLHSLRLDKHTGGRQRDEMDSYREFDRNPRVRGDGLMYQGWTLKRAKGHSSDDKPTWAHVKRSRMDFAQDKLSKLARKKVSPSISQQYRKMGDDRRTQLDNLIEDSERRDQQHDWTCIFIEPTYGADKYGLLDSKLVITSMDVILEGRPKPGVSLPPRNMSMNARHSPERFDDGNRRPSFPPEPRPPEAPPQGHMQPEPRSGGIVSDGPPQAPPPPRAGPGFDGMPPGGPGGPRGPPQGPMPPGPGFGPDSPQRPPQGPGPHESRSGDMSPDGPRPPPQGPIQQGPRAGGMPNGGPPRMPGPEGPFYPPNEPKQPEPRFNGMPPQGGPHDHHRPPPPPPPPPPGSGRDLVQPPPRRLSPSPPRGGPPQHAASGPPPMAPPPPPEGPHGAKPIRPPQYSPPPPVQEPPRSRQSPKQAAPRPHPPAPQEDPMLQVRGPKHKQQPRIHSERNWSAPNDSHRYESHSDGDSSLYDDDSLIESDHASSATGDILFPEEFEKYMDGHGERRPRARNPSQSPHNSRPLSRRPRIHHMYTEPPIEQHQSEDVDIIPYRTAHRASPGRTKTVAHPPRLPPNSAYDGLQLQRASSSAFGSQALSPPVKYMGSPFMDELLRERLWERQQQEVAEGLRRLNMRDRRLREKEEEIQDRELDLSFREKSIVRDQRAVVPRQMVEQLPGYHERNGRHPVERHPRPGFPPHHPRECY